VSERQSSARLPALLPLERPKPGAIAPRSALQSVACPTAFALPTTCTRCGDEHICGGKLKLAQHHESPITSHTARRTPVSPTPSTPSSKRCHHHPPVITCVVAEPKKERDGHSERSEWDKVEECGVVDLRPKEPSSDRRGKSAPQCRCNYLWCDRRHDRSPH
jgi:hypothetical protein